ncbi:protein serine threonine phosphatase 2C [Mycena floridula]|nr:protein serine threonine phosphatase 2C [Mycena floridula]
MTKPVSGSDALRSDLYRTSGAVITHDVHCATFRPANAKYPMEDRHGVEEWELENGKWKYLAVYDGHGAGCEAVEFVAETLPRMLKTSLQGLGSQPSDADVAVVLGSMIRDIDEHIRNEFLQLFGPEAHVSACSDADIATAIAHADLERSRIELLRARTGTTALIALVDPDKRLHVASLGDSQAVLGFRNSEEGWDSRILSANHNVQNAVEANRVRAEHPGEPDCIVGIRTLGLTTLTRALGDMLFKLPAVYTERVFAVSKPPMHEGYPIGDLITRNISPPYLSNQAEVVHIDLRSLQAPFLILCSDGLAELCSKTSKLRPELEIAQFFADIVGDGKDSENMALELLWAALGGDTKAATGNMEITSGGRVDDTTVLVLLL